MKKEGKKVDNLLFFDSLDAVKRFPQYIPIKFQTHYIGKPLSIIPCPYEKCGCRSYAHHFGNEIIDLFLNFGIKTKIV